MPRKKEKEVVQSENEGTEDVQIKEGQEPKGIKRIPIGTKREPKGTKRDPKGCQSEPKGAKNELKAAKSEPKDDQNASQNRCPKKGTEKL